MEALEPEKRPPVESRLTPTHERVLRELRRRTAMTRDQLADAVGLRSRSGRWRSVTGLQTMGLVEQELVDKSMPRFKLAGRIGALIGVDLTLERAQVAVAEFNYALLNDPTKSVCGIDIEQPDATLRAIAGLVIAEAQRAGIAPRDVVGVGLGLPGPVSRQRGMSGAPEILPHWDTVPVAERLAEQLAGRGWEHIPVLVANDASLGALGAYTRARLLNPARAPDDLIYVRVSTGIGAGIVMKGHLVGGADGMAGELGHVRVLPDGPYCQRCHQRGCLEQFASEPAMLERIRERARADGAAVPRDLAEALQKAGARLPPELSEGAWHLGTVLAGVTNFLNPSWIILGGPLAELDAFLATVDRTIRKYSLPTSVRDLDVTSWDRLAAELVTVGSPGDPTPELLGALAVVVDELGDARLQAVAQPLRDAPAEE